MKAACTRLFASVSRSFFKATFLKAVALSAGICLELMGSAQAACPSTPNIPFQDRQPQFRCGNYQVVLGLLETTGSDGVSDICSYSWVRVGGIDYFLADAGSYELKLAGIGPEPVYEFHAALPNDQIFVWQKTQNLSSVNATTFWAEDRYYIFKNDQAKPGPSEGGICR